MFELYKGNPRLKRHGDSFPRAAIVKMKNVVQFRLNGASVKFHKDKKYVDLYFDAKNKRIGFLFTDNLSPYTFCVRGSKVNTQKVFTATAFFKDRKLNPSNYIGSYIITPAGKVENQPFYAIELK